MRIKKKHATISITSSSEEFASIVKSDLQKLARLHLDSYMDTITDDIESIDISATNCSLNQLACVFPDKEKTIYLTKDYFSLLWHERIGTLLHELMHHKTKTYTHVECSSQLILNTNCDENHFGPFGAELLFYKDLLQIEQNIHNKDQLQSTIKKIQIRINQ